MFVDVAALRAKQLRRGALVRTTPSHDTPHKLERIAMDEVRKGLVEYTAPEKKTPETPDRLARPVPGRVASARRERRAEPSKEPAGCATSDYRRGDRDGNGAPGGSRLCVIATRPSSARLRARRILFLPFRVVGWLLFLPLLLLKSSSRGRRRPHAGRRGRRGSLAALVAGCSCRCSRLVIAGFVWLVVELSRPSRPVPS
jgi:DNA-directed RNA polymerase subunit K/omega